MDLEVKKALADAMFNYSANQLKNMEGFEPFEDLQTHGYATVNISFSPQGKFEITKAETYETELEELENAKNELREAKKTINQQEKQIESLNAKLEEATATPEESEEIGIVSPEPKPRRRKRTT